MNYTDAELDVVYEFAWDNRYDLRGGSRNDARALLDRIAQAIAARALRDLDQQMHAEAEEMGAYAAILWRATGKRLRDRADEIEAGR